MDPIVCSLGKEVIEISVEEELQNTLKYDVDLGGGVNRIKGQE